MARDEKKYARVEGSRMAYVDRGAGPTVVFLHGNPTSSYLWRHLIAPLSASYRCLAPDLIGMGDSDKLGETGPDAYDYGTHQRFVDGWFDAVLPEGPLVLVVHDWGGPLGFDWASRHASRVLGIAYTETILGSMPLAAMPESAQAAFRAIRSDEGEAMVLERNFFLERMLAPESTLVPISTEDASEYRRPFLVPGESRRPTLSWPRLLPYDGEPAAIRELADRHRAFLASSAMPKLFVDVQPGRLLVGPLRDACRAFQNQVVVTVPGLHYPQEDSPMEMVQALEAFLPTAFDHEPSVVGS